jgi:hypothetical protein
MSDRLYLRSKHTLLLGRGPGFVIVDQSLKDYTFTVSKGERNVGVRLLQDGKTIEAESVVDSFDPNILQILRTSDYDKLSDGDRKQLSDITRPITAAVRQFAGLLKQELHRDDVSDELIGNAHHEWSPDGNQWFRIPYGLIVRTWTSSLGNLTPATAKSLQGLLSRDEQALVATSYLHQARNSGNRRYQWIYATMAAELAIKEILIRIEPKFQVILEELPSPPLHKLYGGVLESVAGVKSNSLSTLQEGARRRNQLVHNPNSPTPTLSEVDDYICFIEDRVKWLLKEWRKMNQ